MPKIALKQYIKYNNVYDMELRSFNVEKVYNSVVRCRIGDDLGVNSVELLIWRDEIISMVNQIARSHGITVLQLANIRNDGEIWTPYLQIVEMLILMGSKIGVIEYEGKLDRDTIIKFKSDDKD